MEMFEAPQNIVTARLYTSTHASGEEDEAEGYESRDHWFEMLAHGSHITWDTAYGLFIIEHQRVFASIASYDACM